MPFYTIDWTRYVNHADVRGAVDASSTINDVIRVALKIWKFSGTWFGYKVSKKFRYVTVFHKIFVFLLFLCVLFAAALSFRFWPPLKFDAATVQRIVLTLIYCQCVGCTASIFYWQMKKRFKGFAKLLNAATMGIGLMREKERLRRMQYFVLIGFGFWALVVSLYHALAVYLPSEIAALPYSWKSFFWSDKLEPLSLLLVAYAAFNWFMAHVLLADYYAFVTAEMHSLNVDLRADSNLYQVAVLKHYTLIYHRLTHVNRHLNSAFGPLLTLTTFSNYFIFLSYSILFATCYDRLDKNEIILGSASMAMAGSYLTVFTVSALRVKKKGEYFYDVVQDVVAMDWNLDAEYHPVAACNAIFSKPLTFGLAFGTSWTVTGRRLAQIVLITILVVILLFLRVN